MEGSGLSAGSHTTWHCMLGIMLLKALLLKEGMCIEYDNSSTGLTNIPDQNTIPPDVTAVYLSSNLIASVPDSVFDQLSSLVRINLRGNVIQHVGDMAFVGTLLSRLNLNTNRLTTIMSLFDIKDTLNELMLADNLISNMTDMSYLKSLYYLDLSGNRMLEFDGYLLNGTVLEILNLESNRLQTFPQNLHCIGKTLETLGLKYNQISFINSSSLKCLEMLATLNLDHNLLTTIPDVSPLTNSLETLTLSYNRMVNITGNHGYSSQLSFLDITRNQIENFDACLFNGSFFGYD
eukprot:GHVT01074592.1.p1 GENE.GHVT01074592.1~~GHVT01074592.1.p1  ORF type:complete len:292 (-),score=-2.73 GHVT01074592.1:514-1389(-)